MKTFALFGMVLGLTASAAFAECTQPEFLAAMDVLRQAPTAPTGTTGAPEFTARNFFNYAPMSEDLGPERVGPYTFRRMVERYVRDLRDQGAVLGTSAQQRQLAILDRLCVEAQKQDTASVDVMLVWEDLEKSRTITGRSPGRVAFGIFGALIMATLAFIYGLMTTDWQRVREERGAKVIPFPSDRVRRKDSDDDTKRAA